MAVLSLLKANPANPLQPPLWSEPLLQRILFSRLIPVHIYSVQENGKQLAPMGAECLIAVTRN